MVDSMGEVRKASMVSGEAPGQEPRHRKPGKLGVGEEFDGDVPPRGHPQEGHGQIGHGHRHRPPDGETDHAPPPPAPASFPDPPETPAIPTLSPSARE